MKHALAGLLLASALSAGFCAPPAWAEELGQVRFTFDDMENTWLTVILGSLGRKVYTSGGTPPDGSNPLAIDVEFSVRNQVAHMGAERCAALDGQAFGPR